MKVLYLGPPRSWIEEFLRAGSDELVRIDNPIASEDLEGVDFVVSYGYRHIIPSSVIARFGERAVNLHISLLPFNRGSDPNLWSFLEDTPRGVTIHVVAEGLDTGPVLAQAEVAMDEHDTLATSYDRLAVAIEALFRDVWPRVVEGSVVAVPQPAGGSQHRLADKLRYEHLLTRGWDTPVADLIGKAVSEGIPNA
jgi:methionyl-tRNA formyltransferase